MEYKIIVEQEKNDQFFEFMQKKIREYNDLSSPFHRAARKPGAIQTVNIIIESSTKEWVGGLTAEIYWNWLEIKYFWLHEDHRKKGMGTRLLKEAEKHALSQGCQKAFLTTYEFQARTFYERNGYEVAGRLEDYPPGSTFYWMTKTLCSFER